MTWRNLRAELCEYLSETIEARVPLGSFHPNQSVHVERGGRTTFRKRAARATCRECKRVFQRKTHGGKARYCSRACQLRSWNEANIYPLLREVRACRVSQQRCVCGKPARAPRRGSGRIALYCSERCAARTRQKSRAQAGRFDVRLCACGKPAKRPRKTGIVPRCCSGACRQRQLRHKELCEQCIFRGAAACTGSKRKPWSNATMWRTGRPRLTTAQRDEARRMRADGCVLTEIAARLGISRTHACTITKVKP